MTTDLTNLLIKPVTSNTNTYEDALWARYKATGDIVIRNELVMQYASLVEIVVKKMYRVFIGKASLEDIISNGMICLIKSVESFDHTRGIKFDTYASIRLRGSVVDYIRSQDWVPRTVRDKSKQIEDTFIKLRETLDRDPNYGEIADDLQITQEKVETVLCDAHSYNMISLEELITDKLESFDIEDKDNQPAHALLLKKELKEVLAKAINNLSEKERMVISLSYYESLKVKEIAEAMQISSSRVCQIHSTALIKIKSSIKDYVNS